jgi:hypothetical protein
MGRQVSSGNVTKAGGWVVLVFAFLAWCHAAGDITESTFGRKVLWVRAPAGQVNRDAESSGALRGRRWTRRVAQPYGQVVACATR